jgi:hypothetical protein
LLDPSNASVPEVRRQEMSHDHMTLYALPEADLLEQARTHGVNVRALRCDCEACARTSVLCPASRMSIVEGIIERQRTGYDPGVW